MPDETKKSKKPLAILAVVLMLCALAAAWLVLKGRLAKTPNQAPIAALRLDSLDESNRVATLSDGSHDPDGTLQSWRIAWGDGEEENVSSVPRKTAHTYASEGQYTISLWCVDNRGATSSPPAMTNLTLDFLQRQKARELAAQEQAKREADRLKVEEARKESERLERQKQNELAAQEAQKAKEQQELEEKRKAEAAAELARQKPIATEAPPPPPLAAAHPDDPSPRIVIFTPSGYTLGEFQIFKERTEAMGNDGILPVVLAIRCVNFPNTAIPISDWQINGKDLNLKAGRIRASLSPGLHEVTALLPAAGDSKPVEIKADVNVRKNGDCVVVPKK